MATTEREVEYPTSDSRPMAETPLHMQEMIDLIETLQDHFAADPNVYVWRNMMLCYVEGDPRKHISSDVFVVRGVPKLLERDNYLTWKEGKAPDLVVETTSKSTQREDKRKKFIIYRDVLKAPEYFQFEPTEDYLKPPLEGHRLVDGDYVPIRSIDGRLPSEVLGLHLAREGSHVRLYNPATGRRLLTRQERMMEAEAEVTQLRRELEAARERNRSNGA